MAEKEVAPIQPEEWQIAAAKVATMHTEGIDLYHRATVHAGHIAFLVAVHTRRVGRGRPKKKREPGDKVTQTEFAQQAGISQPTVSRYFRIWDQLVDQIGGAFREGPVPQDETAVLEQLRAMSPEDMTVLRLAAKEPPARSIEGRQSGKREHTDRVSKAFQRMADFLEKLPENLPEDFGSEDAGWCLDRLAQIQGKLAGITALLEVRQAKGIE